MSAYLADWIAPRKPCFRGSKAFGEADNGIRETKVMPPARAFDTVLDSVQKRDESKSSLYFFHTELSQNKSYSKNLISGRLCRATKIYQK